MTEFDDALRRPGIFAYAKTPGSAIEASSFLEERGFRVVESNLVLEKACSPDAPGRASEGVRLAIPEDAAGVTRIARSAFSCSRFHLDPRISGRVADSIKAAWAANYFSGNRGDAMVVAEEGGELAGFLQLLFVDETLVIDLVAVDRERRGKGHAARMITFAERNLEGFAKLRTGTQLVNVASLNCYFSLGFRPVSSSHTLHFHG